MGYVEAYSAGLSSYAKAKEIADILKEWIQKGKFELTTPVCPLQGPTNL